MIWRISIILVMNLCLAVFVLISIQQIRRFQNLQSTLDRVLIRTEMARLAERNFLLNSAITEQFLNTGKDNQISINLSNIEENLEVLNELLESRLIDRAGLGQSLDSIRQHTLEYREAFRRIVKLYRKKGFRDWGLEGDMRHTIHYIEDAEIPFDRSYMLMLRRHEKDFLLRKDLRYEAKFNESLRAFEEHLSQYRRNSDQAVLQELVDTLRHYQALFSQIVQLEQEIGLSHKEGVQGKLGSTALAIDRDTKMVIKSLEMRVNRVSSNLIIAISLLFVGSTALLLYRTVTNFRKEELIARKSQDLERSHENIKASIQYARRIQQGILSHPQYLTDIFSEVMLLYRPRDIVSGDFYWFAHKDDYVVAAVVDCTGHGVPGAFMTVLGNALLNQVIVEKGILDPGDALEELDQRLCKILKQGGDSRQEGMDLTLLVYNVLNGSMCFAGAKNPLYHFSKGQLHVFKGDKYSLGNHRMVAEKTYQTHHLTVTPGDSLFMFTDGYSDQFGGEQNTKFLIKNFRQMLTEIQDHTMDQQIGVLEDALDDWMDGKHPQTDDILVLGLRL